jgi:hypothetical protein
MLTRQALIDLIGSEEDFQLAKDSGMFWEYFPECDGTWENFKMLFKTQEDKHADI